MAGRPVRGRCRAMAKMAFSWWNSPRVALTSKLIPAAPMTPYQRKSARLGRSRVAAAVLRVVRPLEMRAMNTEPKGAQLIPWPSGRRSTGAASCPNRGSSARAQCQEIAEILANKTGGEVDQKNGGTREKDPHPAKNPQAGGVSGRGLTEGPKKGYKGGR
jgi:hypothetical protein